MDRTNKIDGKIVNIKFTHADLAVILYEADKRGLAIAPYLRMLVIESLHDVRQQFRLAEEESTRKPSKRGGTTAPPPDRTTRALGKSFPEVLRKGEAPNRAAGRNL